MPIFGIFYEKGVDAESLSRLYVRYPIVYKKGLFGLHLPFGEHLLVYFGTRFEKSHAAGGVDVIYHLGERTSIRKEAGSLYRFEYVGVGIAKDSEVVRGEKRKVQD